MFKKATFLPTQPRRAKTRLVLGKAAARRTARGITSVTFVRAREPVSGAKWGGLYVEALNEARTPLADFFNFLPGLGRDEAADYAHFAELLIALRDELIRGKFD